MHRVLVLAMLACSACRPQHPAAIEGTDPSVLAASESRHVYSFPEKTGITTYVVVGEETVAIRFRRDSDRQMLDSLMALHYDVLRISDASGDGVLVVRGQLGEARHRTETLGEEYQEFRLLGWSLACPFREIVWAKDAPGLPYYDPDRAKVRTALEPTDFPGVRLRRLPDLETLVRPCP